MAIDPSGAIEHERRLDEVLGSYYEAIEAGRAIDPRTLIARHPDLAADLVAFFENEARFRLAADPSAPGDPEDTTLAEGRGGSAGGATVRSSSTKTAQTIGPGDCFGDYELLEEITRGGMGVVYRARQVSVNRIVAMKMLLAGEFASSTS